MRKGQALAPYVYIETGKSSRGMTAEEQFGSIVGTREKVSERGGGRSKSRAKGQRGGKRVRT